MKFKRMVDRFQFMKNCLKRFDYPRIHGLDDTEVADIFAMPNRRFLLSWIFKQIDEEYSKIVDENCSKEDMADLICQHGFCTNSTKIKFVDGKMNTAAQSEILYKMFHYLNNLRDAKKTSQKDATFSIEDINNLSNTDINLFSVYGSKQVLTSKQRVAKIEEYKKDIENLRNLIASKNPDETKKILSFQKQRLEEDLRSVMENAESYLPQFKKAVFEVTSLNKGDKAKISLKQEFGETVKKCAKETENMHKFMKNLDLVTNIKEEYNKNSDCSQLKEPDTKNNKMMREIFQLCSEINNTSK